MLQMYHNDNDWVIAESVEECIKICSEMTGEDIEDTAAYWKPDNVTIVDPNKAIGVYGDDDSEYERHTAAIWIAIHGRGLLASRNW